MFILINEAHSNSKYDWNIVQVGLHPFKTSHFIESSWGVAPLF